ncbi:MAG TPA: efflux RND transporter permease subunit [Planctomycetota bacterium]|nr:efflux RND transporter permease subunit [Planctomycetota bacterium]
MNPIQASVSRPYTVAVAVILAVLFSVIALRTIPIQLKPTVDRPLITISTDFRGAAAVEVEEQLTSELEEVLQSVEGVIEMTSESAEGRSQITLEFDFGTDTQLAVVDVINKLSRVRSLPEEADEPQVEIASSDSQQVMWIALDSHYDANRVRRIVKDDIEPRLKRVPGVSDLLVVGGSENEIQVLVDPERLIGHGVSFSELGQALSRANVNVRGGTVETETRQLVVRTVGRAEEPLRLEDIVIRRGPAGAVRLGDVASVVDTYRETTGFVNINGVPGVAIGISRKSGFNVVELIRSIDASCVELNRIFANRGLDVALEPVYRETTYISAAMDFVRNNMLIGAALALVVLILFLRSLRSVLIVALSIPVSLITVFLVLEALGRSLNVISLAGIAFASGMVVDSAIVVLENTFRHLELGKRARAAAVDAGREVWGAVLASTLTTVAVFTPILLQGDEASELFVDIALAISAAVLISMVVALTVVPVLASLVLRSLGRGSRASAALISGATPLGPLGRGYGRLMDGITSSRATAAKLGFVLLVAAASLATLRIMPPAEYLPTGNRNLVFFFASPIPGTRPEEVRDNFRPLERFILAQPEADRMFAVTGPRFNGGGVVLKDEYADADHLASFYGRLFGPATTLPGFQFVVPVRSSLFEDPGKQFEVELSGPDFDVLDRASQELQERLRAVRGVQFVRSSLVTGRPELHVTIDEHKAKELGLAVSDVGDVVETAVAGRRLSALIEGGREVDVNVVVPPERIASPEALEALRLVAPGGRVVALGSVARVERTSGPLSVRRLERERNVLLTVNIAEDAPLESVVTQVESEVFPPMAAELGAAYTLRTGGSADKLKSTLASLSRGFGLSVLIVYLLLVALFRSWISPFVILTTVPLALSGGLIGIRLAHIYSGGQAGFDVISMLGFIILAGLVVNNAILIVHQANNFREEGGMDPRAALAESARTRLRPILMTVITTVAGMLPLALGGGAGSELYQGIGAIIVGGLLVSTLFTLVLVPVLVSIGHDISERLAKRRATPARAPERELVGAGEPAA